MNTQALPGPAARRAGPFLCAPRPPAVELPATLAQHRGDRPIFARKLGASPFTAAAAGAVTEIEIYDEIGFWGVTAGMLRTQLRGAGDVLLRINSPGGDVWDGLAMFNDLVGHAGRVEVEITGLAASAASFVALAGDRVSIAENAFMMIHNAWVMEVGDRHRMAEAAAVLQQIDEALAATYAARADLTAEEAAAMMDAETWLGAAEAVELGFAEAQLPLAAPTAAFDLGVFAKVPESLRLYSRAAAGEITTRELEQGLRDAGRSISQAKREASALMALSPRDAAPSRPEQPREAANLDRIKAALASLYKSMEK